MGIHLYLTPHERNPMITVQKTISWDMGHRLPYHDHKCRNPHGHRYELDLFLTGPVCQISQNPKEGMLIDFTDLSQIMKDCIYKPFDHCFIFDKKDRIMSSFYTLNPDFKHIAVDFVPTAENLVVYCYERLSPQIKAPLKIEKLILRESPHSSATYTP